MISAVRGTPCRILDIGTGSGCIAVCLAAELPESSVSALDISPFALDYARENARLNGVSVDFVQGDILDEVLDVGAFDVIVSNPPYVPASDAKGMCRNVLDYEPHSALFRSGRRPAVIFIAPRPVSHAAAFRQAEVCFFRGV
ncbi:MAG: methyltransferase [Alistipes putredinis]|nr:MAG: methyltransferase [Alistipes putredinis]